MCKRNHFEEAYRKGVIHLGDYFQVIVPKDRKITVYEHTTGFKEEQKFELNSGVRQLFRLESIEGQLEMLGNPTQVSLILRGLDGFVDGLETMDKIVEALYTIPGVFEGARAYDLPQKNYICYGTEPWEEIGGYRSKQDKTKSCWIASRSFVLGSGGVELGIFVLHQGLLYDKYALYKTGDNGIEAGSYAFPVCPVVSPNSTLLLETDMCDGSMQRPWKCLVP